MHLSDKDFLNRLKLYFSTLFARSMPKVVIGCPDLADNEFLYSNIKLEEMEYYEPDSAYYIHRVELCDSDFFNDLVIRYPVFKDSTWMLYTDKLTSFINKHTGPLENIKIYVDGVSVNISVDTKESSEPLSGSIGELISEYTASQYLRVFNSALVDPVSAIETDLCGKISLDTPYTIIDVPQFTERTCKAALILSGSGVSMKEFPKKADLFQYTYNMLSSAEGTTVRVNTRFKCPLINVTSVQPAIVWFTKTNKKDN